MTLLSAPVVLAVVFFGLVAGGVALALATAGWPERLKRFSLRVLYWLVLLVPGLLFFWMMVGEYYRAVRDVAP